MRVEITGLRELVASIEGAVSATDSEVEAVVSRGALNIKKQLQREMRDSRHFKGITPAISYDIKSVGAFGGGAIEAEIGPESDGPGALANIAYFGTSRGGGTVPDPSGALAVELPKVESALLKFVGGVLD